MTIQLKVKHDQTSGPSLRVQTWNGKLPTYDSEHQRAAALKATAVGVDANGNPLPESATTDNKALQVGTSGSTPAPNDVAAAQAQAAQDAKDGVTTAELHKMKKDDLVAYAKERGIETTEEDTKATIMEKIEADKPEVDATAAAANAGTPPEPDKAPVSAAHAQPVSFDFSPANMLQEITLSPGEEKVLTIHAGLFLTVKEDV